MKLITIKDNLLTHVKAGWIVHGCNSHGVQGSGFALAVKNMYPYAYEVYRDAYETNGLPLGTNISVPVSDDLVVVNSITQQYFGSDKTIRYVSYDAIQACFENLNDLVDNGEFTKEVHIPMIGAGLGGGNWEIIREIIEQTVTFPTTLWILPS